MNNSIITLHTKVGEYNDDPTIIAEINNKQEFIDYIVKNKLYQQDIDAISIHVVIDGKFSETTVKLDSNKSDFNFDYILYNQQKTYLLIEDYVKVKQFENLVDEKLVK